MPGPRYRRGPGMTLPDFVAIEERMREARAALNQAMEDAVRQLARFQEEHRLTEEERQALQEAALRGDLGEDMQTLARRVDSGEDSWDAIFSGASPHAELLLGHLDRMIAENRETITRAIEQEPDFDLYRQEPGQGGG
jgi:hypothetical protein